LERQYEAKVIVKNKIAFIIIALLLNCGTNADYSFNLLGDAFSVWYYKNHPTISTLHNNKYHDIFKRNDFKSNEQYLLDLNRFYFELTQINMQKLNLINKVKYDRVQRTISKLIYLNEIIKEQDWRPSLKLEEIENGIKYLVNYSYLSDADKIDSISGRLSGLEEILENILTNTTSLSNLEYLNCIKKIDSIIRLLNNIEININYKEDPYSYDLIIKSAKLISLKLNTYMDKLESMKVTFSDKKYNNAFDFNNETLKILTESDYSINELYKKAKKEIRIEQIKLFNNSLPTFLKDNDEPVWLDYEDTLNVIRSVIYAIQDDHKIKDLKYVRESYNKSFKHKNDLNVRFDFYNTSYDFLYINEDLDLIDPSNKKIYVNLPELDIQSVFNIKNKTHYFNEIQIDLLNAFKLYPGMGYIRSLDSEKIIHQLPNKTTLRGLQRYAERVFIKSNRNASEKHQIIHQKNIIKDICKCLMDIEYNINDMKISVIEEYLSYNCFLDGLELDEEVYKIKNNYFGLSSIGFIGYYEILDLENLYIDTFNKNYIKFYDKMIENGIVDLENLNIPFN
tara:strand:- start:375 stop:2069 length:1695 start_codon:yes stop_codon:yes gene_type:complete